MIRRLGRSVVMVGARTGGGANDYLAGLTFERNDAGASYRVSRWAACACRTRITCEAPSLRGE